MSSWVRIGTRSASSLCVKDALDTGQQSEMAESLLYALEESLAAFEKHRELVLDQLKRRPSE
jgi:hypothetical protein